MEYDLISVAETEPFRRKAGRLLSVIYFYHSARMPLYLLTVFGKNEKANISAQEKKLLSRITKELVEFWSYRE